MDMPWMPPLAFGVRVGWARLAKNRACGTWAAGQEKAGLPGGRKVMHGSGGLWGLGGPRSKGCGRVSLTCWLAE